MNAPYLMEDPREAGRLAAKVDAAAWAEEVASWLGDGADGRVLDLGCGPGLLARAVADRLPGVEVTAVDGQPDRFDDVLHDRVERLAADASDLPLADAACAAAYSRLLYQFLPDPLAVTRELHRVLRPAGEFLLFDLDGQLVQHDGMDRGLAADCERIHAELVRTRRLDPFVGRKLFGLCRRAGLEPRDVLVRPYHQIVGAAAPEELALWELKLAIARPLLDGVLGSPAAGARFEAAYLDHLRDPETLTYSVSFSVRGIRPLSPGHPRAALSKTP